MIPDRYRNRFLLIGQTKHSLTFPARKSYVQENLLYSTAERIAMRNRINPSIYAELNAQSQATQPIVRFIRECLDMAGETEWSSI
jgi:hypothetical protein